MEMILNIKMIKESSLNLLNIQIVTSSLHACCHVGEGCGACCWRWQWLGWCKLAWHHYRPETPVNSHME